MNRKNTCGSFTDHIIVVGEKIRFLNDFIPDAVQEGDEKKGHGYRTEERTKS